MKNMKKIFLFIPLLILLTGCSSTKPEREELTDWQFEYNEQWYPATVPGFIHTDLMDNGLILDTYYGTNEDSVQWIKDRKWKYKTILRKDDLSRLIKNEIPPNDTLWLTFEGLAGRAEILIQRYLGSSAAAIGDFVDNMFVEHTIPIEIWSKFDSIVIQLFFQYPYDSDSLREAKYGISLPDQRAFTRIAPYQQGWDWGPKLQTCGIWKPVYITNKTNKGVKRSEKGVKRSERTNVELRQEKDSIGQSFTFYRYRQPIFIKGANWIPVHSFPVYNNANRDRYRLLLTSAKEAGFNMLRVWGGGIYEHDYFFDLCDSLDIMVWMDFNFSTMLYPDNPEMLASIKEEAYKNVWRIAQHPCVVLWCGNNEVKNGWEDWGWQDVYHWTPKQRKRLQHGIDTIFGEKGILAQAVKDCDPLHRPYITTSPLYGWGHPECVTHGDSHYWGVWWGEEPFEKYAEKTGRFMSEYGFQSYPMISTIRQFCPEDQLYIDSPTLRSHQKHPRGREIIDKAMRQYYGFDSKSLNLENYCYVSQLLQAWGTGYGIFQHIKQQPHCMGTLYWQLNDCWPVASWSSIDYYGNWKALHYRAQALYTMNEECGMRNEELKRWESYYSVYPKNRNFQKALYVVNSKFNAQHSSLSVTLTAVTDLYDVYIETEPHINGHFTRNFFDLKKGESITTTFIPVDKNADLSHVKVKVKTLNELYIQ